MNSTAERLPLDGVRVVEFSHMVMGPACGLILADLGADVIKVEPVGSGDKTRALGGAGAGFFPMYNRNKRSVAVDLKSPDGIEFVQRLIASADVITENFRPGGLEAMGLGYEKLSAEHPSLIYCSLKGFLAGPYQQRAALDEVVQMMGGLAYMTGPPGQPLRAGASVNDIMGGMFAALGIISALHQREQTGRGQIVRSSLFENNVFLVGQHMAQFAVTGTPAAPMPARVSAWGVYDVFDTSDDEKIFVGIVTDSQWNSFCAAFDVDDLAEDPTLAMNSGRVTARGTLIPRLRQTFAALTSTDAAQLCEAAKLPFAPIRRPEDLFEDPQLNVPGALTEVSLDDGRKVRLPALPLELGGRRLPQRHDLPRTGQHTEEVGLDLGYSPEDIAVSVKIGALGIDSGHNPAPAT